MATLPALPLLRKPATSSGTERSRAAYSWYIRPENTPVLLPRSRVGSTPARSMASQDSSRSIRCWGSIVTASRGEIPKKEASKSAASCRKPPWSTSEVPGRSPVGSKNESRAQSRSVGKALMPSPPSASSCHRSSGESTFPGKRQLMPTMAIGSSSATTRATALCCRAVVPASRVCRWAPSAAGVG